MEIDLPADVVERVQRLVTPDRQAGEVVRLALDAMDRLDQERQAIQVGIDAYNAGEGRDWDEFAAEFRAQTKRA